MGMFDDLVNQGNQGNKGLFGDLVPAQGEKPKNAVADVVRQVGLTGRYAMEGLPQIVDLLASPFKLATDKLIGHRGDTASEMGGKLADYIGLPKPETAQERVVGDVTRTGFGAAGGAGAAKTLSQFAGASAAPVLESLAARPGVQVTSGAAAGGAAGGVREAGGSPMGQTLAALGAGVLAPFALAGVSGAARGVANTVRAKISSPQELDVALKTELGKAGINWDELGAQVKLQLRKDAERAVFSGQPIDSQALRRLADYRNIGATPLLGDITQQPGLVTQQRNLTKQLANVSRPVGGQDLPSIDNANAQRVLSTLEGASPSALDEYATAQGLIGRVQGKDAALKAAETADYVAARAAAGRDIPLDRSGFVNQAFGNLAKSNKGAFLPKEVESLLNQISSGKMTVNGQEYPVPFNVDTIDQLKTVLSSASRASNDGNVKAAIAQVRDALEATQVAPVKADFGGAAVATGQQAARMQAADAMPEEAMRLFDTARRNARDRRQWQESAAFIEDALSGVAPDKYVQKHVIGSTVDDLSKLKTEIKGNAELENAVRKQLVDYILKRGGADSDVMRFGSKGLEDGLKAIGDRKLALFFAPEEIQQIKSAVSVAKYMQAQPVGAAVNNSNSGALMLGRLSDLLLKGSAIPGVGPWAVDPIRNLTLRTQAIPLRNLSSGLVEGRQSVGAKTAVVPLSALLAAPAINQVQDERRP